jgi:hypothetical protein
MNSDEDKLYIKTIELDLIYNFLVSVKFLFEIELQVYFRLLDIAI